MAKSVQVARFGDHDRHLTLSAEHVAAAARRTLPALLPWLDATTQSGSVYVSRETETCSSENRVTARTVDESQQLCLTLTDDVASGDAIRTSETSMTPCVKALSVRTDVRFPRERGVLVARKALVAGGQLPGAARAFLASSRRGDQVQIVAITGETKTSRRAVTLQDGRVGRTTLCRVKTGEILQAGSPKDGV
jgi:flagella basal body P-ring formation protein FlgA